MVRAEHERAVDAVLQVSETDELLERDPTLRRSISVRYASGSLRKEQDSMSTAGPVRLRLC